MPKIVDHEERRAELATAVFRVVAEEGRAAASVRRIAAVSGWSPGTVRHYFSRQDNLITFALHEMTRRIARRVQDRREAMPPGRERALAMLEELLPLDAERRTEATAYLALVQASTTERALNRGADEAWYSEQYLCRLALADLAGLPTPVTEQKPLPEPFEHDVLGLRAVVDGLTVLGCNTPDHMGQVELRSTLSRALDRIALGWETRC